MSSATALFIGCVKGTVDVCYSGLALRYHYTLNPQDANVFGTDVNELAIHVFDDRGLFYEEFVFDEPNELNEDHLIHLPLPDGKWDIITWASEDRGALSRSYAMGTVNILPDRHFFNHQIIKGVTTIEEARLWMKNQFEGEDGRQHVTDKLGRLYYASLYNIETTTSTNTLDIVDVPMMQNTNTLRVIITGLPQVTTRAAEESFTVSADMVNGRYCHDNSICENARPVKYRNGTWEEGEEGLQHDLTILRPFVDDTTSELKLAIPELEQYGYPNGEIALPIIPTMLEHPEYWTQTDLDRANLFIFEFDFDAEMNFTVTVNGWKVIHVIPEI